MAGSTSVRAGLGLVAAAWVGHALDATLAQLAQRHVETLIRTSKSSVEQAPAFLKQDVLSAMEVSLLFGLGVVAIVGLTLLVRGTTGSARTLAIAAMVMVIAHLGLEVWRLTSPLPPGMAWEAAKPIYWRRRWLHLAHAMLLDGSAILTLLAWTKELGRRALGSRAAPAIAGGALVLLPLSLTRAVLLAILFGAPLDAPPGALASVVPVASALTTIAIGSAMLVEHRRATSEPASGFPLRLVAFALLVRIASSFGAQLLLADATREGNFEGQARLMGAIFAVGLANALLLAGCLRAYEQLSPPLLRTSAIRLALAALLIGVVVDGYATTMGVDFAYGAQHASGVFFGPGMEKVQDLQLMLRLCAALTIALGVAFGLALTNALRFTAGALAEKFADAVGIGARADRMRILIVAVLGVTLVIDCARVLFQLARILDQQDAPPSLAVAGAE